MKLRRQKIHRETPELSEDLLEILLHLYHSYPYPLTLEDLGSKLQLTPNTNNLAEVTYRIHTVLLGEISV